jgi:peptidoglycan/LPS O-acetylase OafA/YrhL
MALGTALLDAACFLRVWEEGRSRGMEMIQTHRLRNFDTIRLTAAASVIFSHAFLISDGHDKNEPFVRMTGNIIGIHAVFVFLIVSGFLVTQSLKASSSPRSFAWKRFLRIYPALAACAFVSAFIIAPFFSDLSVSGYLSSTHGAKYLTKVLLLYDAQEIPTVQFYEKELHLGHLANGSLWTIACEIYCYLILFFLAALDLIGIPIMLIGLIGAALFGLSLTIELPIGNIVINLLYCLPSFCMGVAMYFVHARFGMSRAIAFGCLAGLLLVAPTGQLMVVFPILAAYPVIYLGLSESISVGNVTKFGDLSYGTYLYGWPVEQIVQSVVGTSLSPWGLFVVSLPIAIACGWLSWHLVEKRALAFKMVFESPRSSPGQAA